MDNQKKGQNIADQIRKLLLNLDLKILFAEGEIKSAIADFNCHQKIQSVQHQKLAMEAKIRRDCFSNYLDTLKNVKKGVENDLDRVLTMYNTRYKRIWSAYFIEKKSYDEIAMEVGYTRENVKKVVFRLKEDLVKNYKLEEN